MNNLIAVDHQRQYEQWLGRFQPGQLEAYGNSLQPDLIKDGQLDHVTNSMIFAERDATWDTTAFGRAGRLPVRVFCLDESEQVELIQPSEIMCQDMPIKFPETDVRLPRALFGIHNLVKEVISIDAALFERYDQDFAYLSFVQSQVRAGEIQRFSGCHVDGFQGPRLKPKLPIYRTYIITSSDSACYYPHEFQVANLDDQKDDFNAFFTAKADPEQAFVAQDMAAYLINAYCVHEALPAKVTGSRSFLRISFSRRIYDRLGNTVNPMFDYDWDYKLRGQRQRLHQGESNG